MFEVAALVITVIEFTIMQNVCSTEMFATLKASIVSALILYPRVERGRTEVEV